MKKQLYLLTTTLLTATLFVSCSSKQIHSTGIANQTQRVESKLKRSDYTLISEPYTYEVQNKKKFKKLTIEQLKVEAFKGAEKTAIISGADGVLNPVYIVDQKRSKYTVTARVKGYRLKTDDDYIEMENSLKHNPNND